MCIYCIYTVYIFLLRFLVYQCISVLVQQYTCTGKIFLLPYRKKSTGYPQNYPQVNIYQYYHHYKNNCVKYTFYAIFYLIFYIYFHIRGYFTGKNCLFPRFQDVADFLTQFTYFLLSLYRQTQSYQWFQPFYNSFFILSNT